jgi:hypothetical protein
MSEILIEGDGRFPMDVRVPIVATRFGMGGAHIIASQGAYRGRSVGVEMTVRSQMKPGFVGDEFDKTAVYKGGVVIRGMGNGARHLADVFSEAYLTAATDTEPLDQLDLTSIALGGNPMLIETEHVNFKVFHDDEDKLGLYFEMFLHVDVASGYVRFDEKDEEYRENIVKAFAALPTQSSRR